MHKTMERMYEAARNSGVTGQTELAEALNVSPQVINNWEARGASKGGMLTAARVFKCNATWIETGEGDGNFDDVLDDENIVRFSRGRNITADKDYFTIQQYHSVVGSMGDGMVLSGHNGDITEWKVTKEWAKQNLPHNSGVENLCIVTGFGDSMRGLFRSGDPIIVDTGINSFQGDAVYFFRIDNEGFIKRLQRIPHEGIRVISKNSEYETWTITENMDFEIFGRVIKAWESKEF